MISEKRSLAKVRVKSLEEDAYGKRKYRGAAKKSWSGCLSSWREKRGDHN